MSKVFRYVGVSALGLLALVLIAGIVLYSLGVWKSSRTHNVQGQAVTVEVNDDVLERTLRTGRTPEGKDLSLDLMPWAMYAGMTDDEAEAMWVWLESLTTD
jgi:hypothetical protein